MSPRTNYSLLSLVLFTLGVAELALGFKIAPICQFIMAGIAMIVALIMKY